MPVYNVEKYVASAIQSVLAQTFDDFELLIINDCSPDGSLEICRQFNDPRITIIEHEKNRGLAGARNTGIRHSKGNFIAFIDSDDIWEPQKLQLHHDHLENNPKLGISFCRSAFIDEHGNSMNAYQMPTLTHVSAGHYLCRNPIGNGSAPVIRRSVLDEIAFEENLHGTNEIFYFDESFRQSEDIECWIRIRATTQWRIEGLSEALTLYRLNSGGLSADVPKQLASWEAVIAKTKLHSPELIQRYGKLAKAFQLRYLSRQAIRLKDGKLAVSMVNRALLCHPGIIFKDPSRTLLPIGAAYTHFLAPRRFCELIEPFVMQLVGYVQKIRINLQIKRVVQS